MATRRRPIKNVRAATLWRIDTRGEAEPQESIVMAIRSAKEAAGIPGRWYEMTNRQLHDAMSKLNSHRDTAFGEEQPKPPKPKVPPSPFCRRPECGRKVYARKLCHSHWNEVRKAERKP